METDRRSESMQRMYQAARRQRDTLAVHGMQRMEKEEEAFPPEYARPQCTFYRVCSTCESTKMCSGCGRRKVQDEFSSGAWGRAQLGTRLCLLCTSKVRGWWTCTQCQKAKSTREFQKWREKYRKQNGRQVCDKCWAPPQLPRSVVVKAQERLRRSRQKVGKTEAGQSCGRSHGADQGEAQRARGRTRGHGRPSRIATGRAREAENCGARENSNAAEKRCQEAKARRRQAVMLHVSFLSRACEQYRRDGPSGSPQDLWKQVSRQGRESSVEGVCLQMPFLCRPRG